MTCTSYKSQSTKLVSSLSFHDILVMRLVLLSTYTHFLKFFTSFTYRLNLVTVLKPHKLQFFVYRLYGYLIANNSYLQHGKQSFCTYECQFMRHVHGLPPLVKASFIGQFIPKTSVLISLEKRATTADSKQQSQRNEICRLSPLIFRRAVTFC